MKLCRYGKPGYEKPGLIDADGKLRDLSKVVGNIGPNEISPRGLKMLSRHLGKIAQLPVRVDQSRLFVARLAVTAQLHIVIPPSIE